MNVMPTFLRPAAKQTTPPLPRTRPEEMRQMTMEFMNSVDLQRQENAYLRSENEQLRVDLKVAQEQVRMLEAELAYVRDERDQLYRHDSMMLGGLDDIEVLIVNLKQRSRAEAYAQPGTGQGQQQDHERGLTEQDTNALAELVATIRPEGKTDA